MSTRLHRSEVMTMVDALEREGRYLHAIDVLTRANQHERDPEIESRLVEVRHAAFAEVVQDGTAAAPVLSASADVLRVDGIPTVAPDVLTPDVVRAGIDAGGCLRVPGLVPPALVARLVDDIDRAIAGHDANAAGAPVSETTPWFVPFRPGARYREGYNVRGKRASVRAGGGAWTTDSPRALYDLVETFDEVSLTPVIRGFLGERPALAVSKGTLRRVPLTTVNAAWHQDGAFLGTPIRTLNVWLALSRAGVDAPGLDVLPRRLDAIVEPGTDGAIFPWAVAPEMVERAAEGTPVRRPVFAAGDALLFDELFLHRTACEPGMTRERYAIETWLFAPSVYPGKQIPLVI
jgi:hypothetical protein